MANQLYDLGAEGILDGSIDLDDDTIKAVLVDTADYTADFANDKFLADIPSAAREATTAAFTGLSVSGRTWDADDTTFAAASGDECEAMVLFQDTGSESTSRLIAYYDDANGLPATLAGTDIPVSWNASGILSL